MTSNAASHPISVSTAPELDSTCVALHSPAIANNVTNVADLSHASQDIVRSMDALPSNNINAVRESRPHLDVLFVGSEAIDDEETSPAPIVRLETPAIPTPQTDSPANAFSTNHDIISDNLAAITPPLNDTLTASRIDPEAAIRPVFQLSTAAPIQTYPPTDTISVLTNLQGVSTPIAHSGVPPTLPSSENCHTVTDNAVEPYCDDNVGNAGVSKQSKGRGTRITAKYNHDLTSVCFNSNCIQGLVPN